MKLGLDIHGVLSDNPKFFTSLAKKILSDRGGEVHVITGAHITQALLDTLKEYELPPMCHIFSIADHHKRIGTKMWYDEKGTPWMDGDTWDRTKGLYCAVNHIDLHIDDTERYGRYFVTPFLLYKPIPARAIEYLSEDASFQTILYPFGFTSITY